MTNINTETTCNGKLPSAIHFAVGTAASTDWPAPIVCVDGRLTVKPLPTTITARANTSIL